PRSRWYVVRNDMCHLRFRMLESPTQYHTIEAEFVHVAVLAQETHNWPSLGILFNRLARGWIERLSRQRFANSFLHGLNVDRQRWTVGSSRDNRSFADEIALA